MNGRALAGLYTRLPVTMFIPSWNHGRLKRACGESQLITLSILAGPPVHYRQNSMLGVFALPAGSVCPQNHTKVSDGSEQGIEHWEISFSTSSSGGTNEQCLFARLGVVTWLPFPTLSTILLPRGCHRTAQLCGERASGESDSPRRGEEMHWAAKRCPSLSHF